MIRHNDVRKSHWVHTSLPSATYCSHFELSVGKSAYLFNPSLYASFPLYLTSARPLSFFRSLSCRNAPSPLICGRNEDGEFQRESSSSAEARCPTLALLQCSPFPLPLLTSFLSFHLVPYPETLIFSFESTRRSAYLQASLPLPLIWGIILSSSTHPCCSLPSVS